MQQCLFSCLFIAFRFANIYKGHGRCSLELEDYEQERVSIHWFYYSYHLGFSMAYSRNSISPVFWLDTHWGFQFFHFHFFLFSFSGWMDTFCRFYFHFSLLHFWLDGHLCFHFFHFHFQFSGWMDTWVSTRQEELGITRPPPEASKPTKNNRYGRRPSGLMG